IGVGPGDVEPAERVRRLADHVLDDVLVADVTLLHQGAPPGPLYRLRDLRGLGVVVEVVDGDVGAGLRERDGDGPADASACPGDECGLAGELHGGAWSLSEVGDGRAGLDDRTSMDSLEGSS